MKQIVIFLLFCVASASAAQTPEEAFQRLKAGNARFVKEELLHPNRTQERRLALSEGQSPFAVIVTCSDSRVVPEVIFDEGLGDLLESQRQELPPTLLAELYVSLSTHTAPIIQPAIQDLTSNAQIGLVLVS